MALQNKLKAFVRFDGSGRVIPSSLILQKSKPKVGNWKEINATQCCNDNPPITTSTTTTSGSTANAFYLSFWTDLNQACNFPPTNAGLFYSSSQVLHTGSFIFYDAALTSPAIGIYINPSGNVRLTSVSGGYLQPYTCPTTTTTTTQVQSYIWQALYSDVSKSAACSGQYMEIYTSTPYLSDNVNIYLNSSLTQPVLYNYISSGGRVWQCMSGFIYGEQNCSALTTTTTTTTSAPQPLQYDFYSGTKSDACNGLNLTTLYMDGPINYGKQLYTSPNLNTPFYPNVEVRLRSAPGSPNDAGQGVIWYTYTDGRIQWQDSPC